MRYSDNLYFKEYPNELHFISKKKDSSVAAFSKVDKSHKFDGNVTYLEDTNTIIVENVNFNEEFPVYFEPILVKHVIYRNCTNLVKENKGFYRLFNFKYFKNVTIELENCKGFFEELPQKGHEITVYKQLRGMSIAKLLIPENAERCGLFGHYRADKAIVLEIKSCMGEKLDFGYSMKKTGHYIRYVVGKEVKPDKYDPRWWVEATHGIHFFLTEEDAEKYN